MNIIVLVKQVPDTREVKLDSEGRLIREGVESIINPDDRHALEAALRLKEERDAHVTVITMGPPQAIDVISESLGMGLDEGILLTDNAFAGSDTWATSSTLAKAIEKVGKFDLIFCGRQAIDGDTAQVGPQIADYLDISQVTYVFEIEVIKDKFMIVKRRLEDGYERVQCTLPAMITVIAELNQPRYANLSGLIDACREKAPIRIWNAADIGVQTHDVGLAGSLTHVIKTFAPKLQRKAEMIEGDTETAVAKLMIRLKDNKLI